MNGVLIQKGLPSTQVKENVCIQRTIVSGSQRNAHIHMPIENKCKIKHDKAALMSVTNSTRTIRLDIQM